MAVIEGVVEHPGRSVPFGPAVPGVVDERQHTGDGDVWPHAIVFGGGEQRMGFAQFGGAGCEEVGEGVAQHLVAVAGEVEAGVEQGMRVEAVAPALRAVVVQGVVDGGAGGWGGGELATVERFVEQGLEALGIDGFWGGAAAGQGYNGGAITVEHGAGGWIDDQDGVECGVQQVMREDCDEAMVALPCPAERALRLVGAHGHDDMAVDADVEKNVRRWMGCRNGPAGDDTVRDAVYVADDDAWRLVHLPVAASSAPSGARCRRISLSRALAIHLFRVATLA